MIDKSGLVSILQGISAYAGKRIDKLTARISANEKAIENLATSIGIANALGYTPANKNGYQLLGVYDSGTEDRKEWHIRQDSAGRLIKCSRVLAIIQGASTLAADSGISAYIYGTDGTTEKGAGVWASHVVSANTQALLYGDTVGNVTISTIKSANDSGTIVDKGTGYQAFNGTCWISGIYLYSGSNTPAGTTLTLYGVPV